MPVRITETEAILGSHTNTTNRRWI